MNSVVIKSIKQKAPFSPPLICMACVFKELQGWSGFFALTGVFCVTVKDKHQNLLMKTSSDVPTNQTHGILE